MKTKPATIVRKSTPRFTASRYGWERSGYSVVKAVQRNLWIFQNTGMAGHGRDIAINIYLPRNLFEVTASI